MELEARDFQTGDFEKYIKDLTKDNMEKMFREYFGGWSDVVNERKFFEVLKEGFVKLFFLEDEFIGFASMSPEKNDKDSLMFHDIHILKKFQQKGYGAKIMDYIISKATEMKAKQIKLFVFEKNPALNFHKKHGFVQVETVERTQTIVMIRKI